MTEQALQKRQTGAVMLYESEIVLIIVEALNGNGEHPLRGTLDAADILEECSFPEDVREALKMAANRIINYFAKAAHEAGLSPDDHAHMVREGTA